MGRKHALVLSLALAACTVTGASAALRTVHLGTAAAKPPRVADRVIAARSAKLDRFAASLAHARHSRPPALPPVPHYAPVPMPTPPAPAVPAASRVPAAAPTAAPAAARALAPRRPKVVYVRPAPVVTTVQSPATTSPAQTGDDGDDGNDDGGDRGDGDSGGFGGDDGGDG